MEDYFRYNANPINWKHSSSLSEIALFLGYKYHYFEAIVFVCHIKFLIICLSLEIRELILLRDRILMRILLAVNRFARNIIFPSPL